MSGMARAELIYSENVYLIIQIQRLKYPQKNVKKTKKMAESDMAFTVPIVLPSI